jgi:hypothetical protein
VYCKESGGVYAADSCAILATVVLANPISAAISPSDLPAGQREGLSELVPGKWSGQSNLVNFIEMFGSAFVVPGRAWPQPNIRRIGLVLNGNSHRRAATLDAHDYSLHRLDADADRTFDGASAGTPELIRREVLGAVE